MTHLVNTLSSLELDPTISSKLNDFSVIFTKWNKRINLSAARSLPDIEEHIIDSLHVVPFLRGCDRVIDVGSGGGFPVVMAAICLPTTNFTALEPVHKKHAFLRSIARELDLVNLESFAVRVEDHGVRDYDAACSRATFDLPEWLDAGLGLVHDGGLVVGFEAVPRDDLPAGFERRTYELAGKSRAIISVRRSAAST